MYDMHLIQIQATQYILYHMKTMFKLPRYTYMYDTLACKEVYVLAIVYKSQRYTL